MNKWVALPTTLFDGSTIYSFARDAWVTDPQASELLGLPDLWDASGAVCATVSDTCGAGAVNG